MKPNLDFADQLLKQKYDAEIREAVSNERKMFQQRITIVEQTMDAQEDKIKENTRRISSLFILVDILLLYVLAEVVMRFIK